MTAEWSDAAARLTTIRDLLRLAVSRFNQAGLAFGHGSSDAYDEAAYLILHTLALPLDRLEPFLDARLLPTEIERVIDVLQARIELRLPAAYLTHEAWLGAHRFYVDERVIVPRSFIAEVLPDALEPWLIDPQTVAAVLDLCTGSGCLAILAALSFPHARVDAADISADALAVAQRNISEYELSERVRLVQSDLYAALGGSRYDLIICNPPYVNAESMRSLPHEYRHEPALALAGGDDGLDHIRLIVRDAAQHLNEGGVLVVEAGHNRDAVDAAFPHLCFTWLDATGGDVFLLTAADLDDTPALRTQAPLE